MELPDCFKLTIIKYLNIHSLINNTDAHKSENYIVLNVLRKSSTINFTRMIQHLAEDNKTQLFKSRFIISYLMAINGQKIGSVKFKFEEFKRAYYRLHKRKLKEEISTNSIALELFAFLKKIDTSDSKKRIDLYIKLFFY